MPPRTRSRSRSKEKEVSRAPQRKTKASNPLPGIGETKEPFINEALMGLDTARKETPARSRLPANQDDMKNITPVSSSSSSSSSNTLATPSSSLPSSNGQKDSKLPFPKTPHPVKPRAFTNQEMGKALRSPPKTGGKNGTNVVSNHTLHLGMLLVVLLAIVVAILSPRLIFEPVGTVVSDFTAKTSPVTTPVTAPSLLKSLTTEDRVALEELLNATVKNIWYDGFDLTNLSQETRQELNTKILASAQKKYLRDLLQELLNDDLNARQDTGILDSTVCTHHTLLVTHLTYIHNLFPHIHTC